MKKFLIGCMLSLSLMMTVGATGAMAVESIDSINKSGNSSSSQTTNKQESGTEEYPVDKNESVSSYFKSYRPVTDENMKSASKLGSPIVAILGNITGFILILTSAGIFVVTALDLSYIGLPIVRPLLAPQQASGGMSGGMGGMGGMGGGYGGMHGGMGGMGGGQQAPQGHQWVSDEALRSVQSMSAGQQGGGMQGGMGMGSMGGQQQQPQTSTKSVIFAYFKARMFFLIVFGLASVMLTSSVFLDCGINVAQLGFKVVASLNSAIQGIF